MGVDLVPFKTCSYDCVYCQLGRTTDKTIERATYVPVEGVLAELERRLASVERPDYITLAGSGEPTLHAGIGDIIAGARELTDVPVAVLTNGSLLWIAEVREALSAADLVVPSLDAGDEAMFQRVNRPDPRITFDQMLEGLIAFTHGFPGEVWLEVLLLEDITSSAEAVSAIASHVANIRPSRVQLNTAWRPAAETGVRPVPLPKLEELSRLFSVKTEVVAERAADVPDGAGRTVSASDVLAMLHRRPCTARDIAEGLNVHAAEVLKVLDGLLAHDDVTTQDRDGRTFYVPGASA